MNIGYARVSKADGSQALDLQGDALKKAGVKLKNIYHDRASGKKEERPGLSACLKALREDDVLVVWKLDRLGRDLRHLVNTVQALAERRVGFKVLTGQGADIDSTTASGQLVFGIFAALAEFERELMRERQRQRCAPDDTLPVRASKAARCAAGDLGRHPALVRPARRYRFRLSNKPVLQQYHRRENRCQSIDRKGTTPALSYSPTSLLTLC